MTSITMNNPQSSFRLTSFNGPSMLKTRRETIRRVTVKTQLRQLRETGRYTCFKLQWHPVYDGPDFDWPVPKSLFWDSDIAKWIEAACYFLADEYDKEVDEAVRELVDDIRSAQQPDGYLNVYFTVVKPEERWSNIRDMHELYNAGHLIEAAIAHKAHYRNDLLLEPIEKYITLINSIFGPGENQKHGYPGHPEIELALLRLYKATGNKDAYELAKYFLEERGNSKGQNGQHFYDWEEEKRGHHPYLRPNSYSKAREHSYNMAQLPITEQKTVEGHSVRAMYLLTAVADLVVLHKDKTQQLVDEGKWQTTIETLWNNMVDKKMYVTGGIGAIKQWEGFGLDYFLPQSTDEGGCYAETCASIGVMMFADRLLKLDLDSKYADIMELCLYNNVMTAMDLSGNAFTYENQLASSETDKSQRHDWFVIACCPPNLMRLFGSIGGYLWDVGGKEGEAYVNVHLYATAKVEFDAGGHAVTVQQTTNWPWEGKVDFEVVGASNLPIIIRLRIPGWARGKFSISPACPSAKVEKGYLVLPPTYTSANPNFTLTVEGFAPRHIAPHPYTNQRTLTVARGPLIYCVEDFDNAWEEDHFKNIAISPDTPITEEQRVFEKTGESYIALKSGAWRRSIQEPSPGGAALQLGVPYEVTQQKELVFVPYYFRANRGGKGHMRVGLLST